MTDSATDSDSATAEIWLASFIDRHGAVSGTLHLRCATVLQLKASIRIPPQVLAIIETIPEGKGMAGLAWQRDEPVTTCNIKTDETGDVRPGAKAVDAQAALALPIHHDGLVAGVVGIAFADERTLTERQLNELALEAETAPRY